MSKARSFMPKILSIQYLRAAAALMVVYFHADGMAQEYFSFRGLSFGAAGVDIFFVISGFIMWITTASDRITPASFAVNRIIRIVPLYWVMTLLLYGGWLIFRDPATLPSLWNLLRSLLFIPFVSPRTGEIQPLLIAGWTLNFEMFFYAVFACGLLIARRHRALFVCTILGALVASPLVITPSGPVALTYTSPLLIEFMVGCLLGIMYERRALPRPAVAMFLLVIGCGLLLTSGMLSAANITAVRFWHWGLPAFLIVTAALALESKLKQWRLPMLLGDASYSIYLAHGVALSAVKSAVLLSGTGALPHVSSGFILAGGAASVVAGVAVYFLIERPLVAACKSSLGKRRRQLAQPA
ncbi:exopolysaccharide production protein ExoZ [Afipia massiliensis]|uniref:Exopolysaccharide production protein ExoZ n=1 Tax=Afipia massiliensis TaxID=211460 RepID=A0A840N2I7_9BRAD|nr:acyltransferase [Afipia massiliensis]MBB5054495.1 exopolysaccharide production protein ExoZ [Afipia massiliensis]